MSELIIREGGSEVGRVTAGPDDIEATYNGDDEWVLSLLRSAGRYRERTPLDEQEGFEENGDALVSSTGAMKLHRAWASLSSLPGVEVEFVAGDRDMAAVPEGAVHINDPAEAPAGARIIEGPRGGLYYVPTPSGETPETGSTTPGTGSGETDTSTEVVDADPESFAEAVGEFIERDPEMGAFLTAHDAEELADHTILMTPDGGAGVSVSPQGDIQNLFNHDGPDGAGRDLVEAAVEAGGRTLDCYDGYLPRLYREFGFRETARMEFNPAFAPDGWNEERFGQPDVVFMHYDPETDYEVTDNYVDGDEWDDAKEASRERAVDVEGQS